jgi:hypothetical protein
MLHDAVVISISCISPKWDIIPLHRMLRVRNFCFALMDSSLLPLLKVPIDAHSCCKSDVTLQS